MTDQIYSEILKVWNDETPDDFAIFSELYYQMFGGELLKHFPLRLMKHNTIHYFCIVYEIIPVTTDELHTFTTSRSCQQLDRKAR